MRHKYETRAIVLSRSPAGETNATLALITPGLGLVYARAQGVRRSGAKLAAALATFSESELVLVRGTEQWRVTGAVLAEHWLVRMPDVARGRATRFCGLLLRLVAGETHDVDLFLIVHNFFEALSTFPDDTHEAVEILAVLNILAALGLDTGGTQEELSFSPATLSLIAGERAQYIARINRGIEASGL